MLQSLQSARAADLDRMLRDVEQRITRLSRIAQRAAPGAVDRLSDTLATALNDVADRFRSPARMRADAAQIGDEALRAGHDALRRLARETEQRPLLLLAIAVGVGALAFGLLSRR